MANYLIDSNENSGETLVSLECDIRIIALKYGLITLAIMKCNKFFHFKSQNIRIFQLFSSAYSHTSCK